MIKAIWAFQRKSINRKKILSWPSKVFSQQVVEPLVVGGEEVNEGVVGLLTEVRVSVGGMLAETAHVFITARVGQSLAEHASFPTRPVILFSKIPIKL